MAYVPPKKQNHTKQLVIIALVLLIAAGATWGYQIWHTKQPDAWQPMTICGFSEEKTKERLQGITTETYTIRDYQFYGESLNVFANPYALENTDDIKRKSITMHNLCTDEKITYTMEESADRQIDLVEPQPGFYALTVHDEQKEKQLVYEGTLHSEPFYTLRRNGRVKRVTLIADREIVEPALTSNPLFLQIDDAPAPEEIADVFIDPYGDRMINGVLQPSGSANGLQEAKEMQEAAEQLKKELEGYGLRVVLAKDEADAVLGYYDENGIMKKAYDSHAKYYIELGMNASSEIRYSGAEIYYSNYSSATLANTLMYHLKRETSITPSNMYQWEEHSEGVSSARLAVGKEGTYLYDAMPSLRESGGRISGAASISAEAQENDEMIQTRNSGMQALSVNFIYLTNQGDAQIWKQEKTKIIEVLATAFVEAIHVKES